MNSLMNMIRALGGFFIACGWLVLAAAAPSDVQAQPQPAPARTAANCGKGPVSTNAILNGIGNGQFAHLVACGVSVDSPILVDGERVTPLQFAASLGRVEIVREVLDAGADPNGSGSTKLPPLDIALGASKFAAAHELLARGARADYVLPELGLTSLMSMAFVHDFNTDAESLATTLLARGAPLDATDRSGDTALHHAARTGKARYVRLLLEAGANRCAVNRKGKRPVDVPRRNGEDVVALLQGPCPAAAPASGAASR